MKYNELTLRRQKAARRSGRGISAGRGKTAGRGTKGQGARKSGGVRPGFEGGQMPLSMRLPKLRGFKSHRPPVEVVYTGQLEKIRKTAIDTKTLFEERMISSPYAVVKLLVKGDLNTKKQVRLPLASQGAAEAIKKAGGEFSQTDRLARPAKKTPKE